MLGPEAGISGGPRTSLPCPASMEGESDPPAAAAARLAFARSICPTCKHAPCTRLQLDASGYHHCNLYSPACRCKPVNSQLTAASSRPMQDNTATKPILGRLCEASSAYCSPVHQLCGLAPSIPRGSRGTHDQSQGRQLTTDWRRASSSWRSCWFSASTCWWEATSWLMRCRSRLFSLDSRSTSSSTACMCVARRRRILRAASLFASRLQTSRQYHIMPGVHINPVCRFTISRHTKAACSYYTTPAHQCQQCCGASCHLPRRSAL